MKINGVKVTVCAAAAAILASGMPVQTEAARMANMLPAAGVGLVLEESSSISQLEEAQTVRNTTAKKGKSTQKRTAAAALLELNAAGDSLLDKEIDDLLEESTAYTAVNLAYQNSTTEQTESAETDSTETESEAAGAKTESVETDGGAGTASAEETESNGTQETDSGKETETETESVKETAAETESAKETAAETEAESEAETEAADVPAAASARSVNNTAAASGKEIVKPVSLEEINRKNAGTGSGKSGAAEEAQAAEENGKTEEQESDLIIAQVNDYVNIRQTPDTEGEIVGKLYDNSVGTLIREENGWYEIQSGNVAGYVKSDYFVTGNEAKKIADEVGDKVAEVNTETLFVREQATTDSSVIDMVPMGEELSVLEEADGWVKVSVEGGDGYVSKDYLKVHTVYVTAESVAEEKARLEKEERAKEEAAKAAEEAARKLNQEREAKAKEEAVKKTQEEAQEKNAEAGQTEEPAEETRKAESIAATSSSMGKAVAEFAVQFVGNPYVYGGTSLTNGADCSGFVMSVYENFGVSLPHSSSADRSVGYDVGGLANAQPGDLVCYSGHVGLYIGNGQIVHASTAKTGIKISNADYRKVLAVRRIFT